MKPLLRVRRDTESGYDLRYLYYSENAKVANTVDVIEGGSVALDLAADGSVVGVELLGLEAEERAALERLALDYGLSLEGFE